MNLTEFNAEFEHKSVDNVAQGAEHIQQLVKKLHEAGLFLDKMYTPLVCLLGCLGNTLSLIVFASDPVYRVETPSYYLSALAVTDTGLLLSLFAVWLEGVYGGVITKPFTCPLVMYIGQVTGFISVYLLVGFSFERYVAINFPFARRRLCTISTTKKIIAGIGVAPILMFAYVWWIAKVIPFPLKQVNSNTGLEEVVGQKTQLVCSVPEEFFEFSRLANYIDTLITFVIPFGLITWLNYSVRVSVGRMLSQWESTVDAGSSCLGCGQNSRVSIGMNELHPNGEAQLENVENRLKETRMESTQSSNLQQSHNTCRRSSLGDLRVTKMLYVVSAAFLTLNLPLHLIRCAQFIQVRTGNFFNGAGLLDALLPWANILFNTNFAINFLLYYHSGRKFRHALHTILSQPWRSGGRASSSIQTVPGTTQTQV